MKFNTIFIFYFEDMKISNIKLTKIQWFSQPLYFGIGKVDILNFENNKKYRRIHSWVPQIKSSIK